MRVTRTLAVCGTTMAIIGTATAQEINWSNVDGALGRTASVSGDVHRYGFPRSDLQVTLDGVTIRPALALGGWVAFKPAHGEVILIGHSVSLQTEVNAVMATRLDSGIDISAAHLRLHRASPPAFYTNVAGHGYPLKLAPTIHTALKESQSP